MTDVLTRPEPQTEAEIEEELNRLLTEIEALNEQMRRDQADINKLKIESDAYKAASTVYDAETMRFRSEMKYLDEQRDMLQSQTRASLDRIKAMVARC